MTDREVAAMGIARLALLLTGLICCWTAFGWPGALGLSILAIYARDGMSNAASL